MNTKHNDADNMFVPRWSFDQTRFDQIKLEHVTHGWSAQFTVTNFTYLLGLCNFSAGSCPFTLSFLPQQRLKYSRWYAQKSF